VHQIVKNIANASLKDRSKQNQVLSLKSLQIFEDRLDRSLDENQLYMLSEVVWALKQIGHDVSSQIVERLF
jgi:hypothetical protein